jgi:alkanesulfonate monooxygenase SsuD/methylene tetrahydromethanopterin reductase-like flavin-dependent oxidoreductase (luciferase family)
MQSINGSPEEVVTQLEQYAEAGASEIVCLFNSPEGSVVVEHMEVFAHQVMPLLSAGTTTR